jgi:hypothetical protein
MHTCKYCGKNDFHSDTTIEGVKCTCPNPNCEVPETVICGGPLCQLRFQCDEYKRLFEELKEENEDNKNKLKEIVNINRVLGITPKAFEVLIKTTGINTQGLMISQNPNWSWDILATDDLITVGMSLLEANEKIAHSWAQFLNEKGVNRLSIKKEQLAESNKKLAEAEKIRNGKVEIKKVAEAKEKKEKLKLTTEEKMILSSMKIGLTQAQAIASLSFTGLDFSKIRDLKDLK